MKFHRVLAGVAVRPPGNNGAAAIDDPTGPIVELTQHQLSIGCLGQRLII